MTDNRQELSNDFIMMVFTKIDNLVNSNASLAIGINELNFAITSLQTNCKDLKEELKQTRHDSKNAIISINQNYDTLDGRLIKLEKERDLRDILDREKQKREKKRINFLYWALGVVLTLMGALHISWKKFIESLMVFYG